MKFKSILIISSLIVLLGACKEKATQTHTDDNNGAPVTYFKNDDETMNKAIETAQKTFDQFKSAFSEAKSAKYKNSYDTIPFSDFTIKIGFPTKDNSKEHMWVGDIEFTNNRKSYTGTLFNEPAHDVGYNYGDKILIEESLISDWMYTDTKTNKIHGGYTIQVMRNAMSDEERQDFDESTDYIYTK